MTARLAAAARRRPLVLATASDRVLGLVALVVSSGAVVIAEGLL